MANSINARRQGDEYQALFFWKQLLRLLADENVSTVVFENKEPAFVDDVVVMYKSPVTDQQTGERLEIDFFQCKYHVAQDKPFSLDAILNPEFIGSKESLIKRLHNAYISLKQQQKRFRLTIVSSAIWNSQDPMSEFLSTEGRIRSNLYMGGSKSKAGTVRQRITAHLGISNEELKPFLELIRFDLGRNRSDLIENLNFQMENLGLVLIDLSITDTRYSGLVWKLFEQKKQTFDKAVLKDVVREEKLLDGKSAKNSNNKLFVLRHQSLNQIAPFSIKTFLPSELNNLVYEEIVLDQSDMFTNGELIDPMLAIDRQQKVLSELQKLLNANPSSNFAYYGIAHIPLVFLAGFQLNRKKRIFLFEHNRMEDTWDLLQKGTPFSPLTIQGFPSSINASKGEVIIKFSVSYYVPDDDVFDVTPNFTGLIDIKANGIYPDNLQSEAQLLDYAVNFRRVLDTIHHYYPNTELIHLFYAGPVSLAFKCGQLISSTIHPDITVYNYRHRDMPHYKWGIKITSPVNSPDFFVKF